MTLGIDASRAEGGQHTGVEFYSIHIIKSLMPLVPSDWHVVLYSRGGDLSALGELPANWRVQVIKAPLNRAWTILALSFYFLRGHKPDIFFEPSHITPLFASKKSIAVIHDTAWRAFPKAYSWKGKIILEQSLRHARKAATVIVPSEFVKQELGKIHFNTDHVVAIPHGLDHTAYHVYEATAVAPTLAKYNLTRPYVLTVGRIEEKKNTGKLLEAWELSGLAKEYDLVLVGKPGFGGASIIKQAGKTPGVRSFGWTTQEDLPCLYAGARAVAFPSLYEGFGFPALEAAASGVPVVAANIPVLREIMGDAALWVDPSDVQSISNGLVRVINEEVLRGELIARGLDQAKKFTWERAGAATWSAIAALV